MRLTITPHFQQKSGYTDLHQHLYGCLTSEMLWQIGKSNPAPRWEIYTSYYHKVYGIFPETDEFFTKYKTPSDLREIYLFKQKAPFPEFQCRFNLIIALSAFTPEEIFDISREIVRSQSEKNCTYAEYRIMYGIQENKENYFCKTLAACEGLRQGMEDAGGKICARLVVSLHRDGSFHQNYLWLKELMKKESVVNNFLVAIDFCNAEEGHPPKGKKEFIQEVLRDNQSDSVSALAILYHVGESYLDKSPRSAVRWVWEASTFGAHRLGHCLALGLQHTPVESGFRETVAERMDQILFDLENYTSLKCFNAVSDKSQLEIELQRLKHMKQDAFCNLTFQEKDAEELLGYQEYVMNDLKKNGTVVESCPTSNVRIGMLDNMKSHPFPRFYRAGLKVTISTDDAGIFDTDIQSEYELAEASGLSRSELESVRIHSFDYTSDQLSGRKISCE